MQSLGTFSATERTDDAIMMIGVHGNFHFAIAPSSRIEALLAAHIPRIQLKGLAEGYGTKWWDYRRMAPGHCYGLFIHHYYRHFKIAARTMLNHRKQGVQFGKDASKSIAIAGMGEIQFTPEGIFERDRAHITGMMKAMQVCDTFGVPYEHYCRLAFQVAKDNAWTRLPRPSQIYNDKIGALALNAWETYIEGRLVTATHPLFELDNYAGMQVQDDYRAWLIAQVKKRTDPARALATTVYERPQLPLEMVQPIFPAASLNRARLLAA